MNQASSSRATSNGGRLFCAWPTKTAITAALLSSLYPLAAYREMTGSCSYAVMPEGTDDADDRDDCDQNQRTLPGRATVVFSLIAFYGAG